MTLSWNEIKDRALKFSKEWAGTSNEEADAKPFLVEFFSVFGISRRRVSTFEYRVKKQDEKDGYIDLLWKGTILVEMKSRGKNLDKAYQQAKDYLPGLKEFELPKFILVSDFENFRLYDLEENRDITFQLADLVNNVRHFGYLLGYQKKIYKEQDPANIKAAELMGRLHDRLKEIGYAGHPLEVYLVRILFMLFAEDTSIFHKQQLQGYIEQRTQEDGSDLAAKLQELFQVLSTSPENRFKNLDEQLADFPYVNGKLFEEILPTASFDSKMRQALLDCCYLDWSKISPAIFGSMFQSVMNPVERRNLGAHYTSEGNILKLIKPLFLDELWAEFERIKDNNSKLYEFHNKLSALKFLDPACGCGNFLVVTYRELRLLEIEILKNLNKSGQRFLNVTDIIWLNIDQFYGIECEEFPARIAEVAMWLVDHQMNMLVSSEFGQYFTRLPLKKTANIIHGNALQIDWQNLLNPVNSYDVVAEHANVFLAKEESIPYGTVNIQAKSYKIHRKEKPKESNPKTFDYIMGNPPFIGSKMMTQSQRNELISEFNNLSGSGVLDYVTAWYAKAARYIQGTKTRVAFVSTSSIVQGEQASILWRQMLSKFNIKIHFAHRTFRWSNEAKGNAAVFCVIVGFANFDTDNKKIFDYDDVKGEAHEINVKNINPYLVEGKDMFIDKRNFPICNVPKMLKGSQPTDGGHFIFTEEEKNDFLVKEPKSAKYIRPLISAYDFLNGQKRFCLWLVDASPNELRGMPYVLQRIEKVRQARLKSAKQTTVKWASKPMLFTENRQPQGHDYLIVPSVSSERRRYIPIGFENETVIATNLCLIIPNGSLFHFGILTSAMHVAWAKNICGRLGVSFRYSNTVVYNNYPWPNNPTERQIKAIELAAQKVLDTRATFGDCSLADLYDPLTMPPALLKAHNELDKAVDIAYRPQPFTSESQRLEFLFELYEKYTADLFVKNKINKANKQVR
jgi:type I restriction-modification system DNA methylase subunit